MKLLRKKEKGITLIALVVTIIVLLILAGISIGAITGDNGIINQAKNAKDDTQRSQWEEQIDVAIIDAESKNKNPTMEDVIEELKNKNVIDKDNQVNEETGAITTNDPTYIIEGKLNNYMPEIFVANKIQASDFGAIVNGYECKNNLAINNWQIFYADENNIYIIADDYIPYEYIPIDSFNYRLSKGKTNYNAYFSNNNRYNGSESIVDEKIKMLNNDYFEIKGYTSNSINMNSVAYMLDTKAWSVYKGNYGDYAIGGPTVELLTKSYNKKYRTNYETQASNAIGYQVRKDSSSTWENSIIDSLNFNDSTYVIKSIEKAQGMWMASPSANAGYSILYVYYEGNIVL